MSFVFSMLLFFVLSPSLWSLCVFPSQICGDGVDVGWELCWGSMGLCGLILVVGVLLSWVHVFGVISVVLMSVLVWSCWVWGLFMVCFLVLLLRLTRREPPGKLFSFSEKNRELMTKKSDGPSIRAIFWAWSQVILWNSWRSGKNVRQWNIELDECIMF